MRYYNIFYFVPYSFIFLFSCFQCSRRPSHCYDRICFQVGKYPNIYRLKPALAIYRA